MTYTADQIDSRLHFFSELLSYNSNCFLWTYAADGALLSTNCPKLVLDNIFRHNDCYQYMMEHSKTSTAPLMLSSSFGMVWGAAFEEEEGQLERIHVLGPVLTQTMDHAQLDRAVWGKITPRWKPKFYKIMEMVPVLSFVMFSHRIMMMQYCITGERIQISDIVMQQKKDELSQASVEQEESSIYADRIQVHMAEQSLLSMIRNGDTNYKTVMSNASRVFTSRHQLSADPLQHAKLGQVQFIALCCDAALAGGLAAETAYTRKDAYVQDVENARSISEITQIGMTMYEDYIMLVHNQRVNLNFSKPVRSTCDYIENHLGENLSAQALASRVGYSDYYLSRMFKRETGFSIDEYARNARIERAKTMLADSSDDIQDIAEALGFGGRNYFAVTFKKVVGMPPAAYRKKHQRL